MDTKVNQEKAISNTDSIENSDDLNYKKTPLNFQNEKDTPSLPLSPYDLSKQIEDTKNDNIDKEKQEDGFVPLNEIFFDDNGIAIDEEPVDTNKMLYTTAEIENDNINENIIDDPEDLAFERNKKLKYFTNSKNYTSYTNMNSRKKIDANNSLPNFPIPKLKNESDDEENENNITNNSKIQNNLTNNSKSQNIEILSDEKKCISTLIPETGLNIKMKPIKIQLNDSSNAHTKTESCSLRMLNKINTTKVYLTSVFMIKLINMDCYHILGSYTGAELMNSTLKNSYYIIANNDRCYKLPEFSTPLHVAAILGKYKCIEVILQKIMHHSPKEIISYPHYNSDGHTALMDCVLSACLSYSFLKSNNNTDQYKNSFVSTLFNNTKYENKSNILSNNSKKNLIEPTLTKFDSDSLSTNNYSGLKKFDSNDNQHTELSIENWCKSCELLKNFEGGMRTMCGTTALMMLLKYFCEWVAKTPSHLECVNLDSIEFYNLVKQLFAILVPTEAGIGFFNPIVNDRNNTIKKFQFFTNDNLDNELHVPPVFPIDTLSINENSAKQNQKNLVPPLEDNKIQENIGLFDSLISGRKASPSTKFNIIEIEEKDYTLYTIAYTALHLVALSGFGLLKIKNSILREAKEKNSYNENVFFDFNSKDDVLYKEANFTNCLITLIQREASITSFMNSYSPLMLFAMSRPICKLGVQNIGQYLKNSKELLDSNNGNSNYLTYLDIQTNEVFDYLLEANAGLFSSQQHIENDAPDGETATMIAARLNNPIYIYGLYQYCITNRYSEVYKKELKQHDASPEKSTALMKAILTHNVCVPPLSILESREVNSTGESSLFQAIQLYHRCLTFLGVLKQQGISNDNTVYDSLISTTTDINDPDIIHEERSDEDFFELVQNLGNDEAIKKKLIDDTKPKEKQSKYIVFSVSLPMDNIFGRPMTIRSIIKRQNRVRNLLTCCQYNIRTLIALESGIQTSNDKRSALMLTCQLGYVIYSHMLTSEKNLVDRNNCTALVYTYQSYYNYKKEVSELNREEESDKAIKKHFETLIDELLSETKTETITHCIFKFCWAEEF